MQKTERISNGELNRNPNSLSIPCLVLCVVFVLILGFLPWLPSAVTQPLRAIVIVVFFLVPETYSYRANKTIWLFGIFLFYKTLVFLSNQLTHFTFMYWMSAMLFGMFFIVASQRMWSSKEIRAIIFTSFFACVVYGIILHVENPNLFKTASEGLVVGTTKVNTNAAAYTIGPGAISGLLILLFYENRNTRINVLKLITFVGTLFCYYTLLCLGQRSAFFSALFGAILLIWEYSGRRRNKTTIRTVMILLVAVGLVLGPRVTEGTHAERLFDYENLTDDNGRKELNERAIEMIKEKPVFGGGYDYWEYESDEELGLHNGMLMEMVIGGAVSGILLSLFFLTLIGDTIAKKSLIPLAYLAAGAFHMFTDSGLDYYTYVPMILAYILIRNAYFRRRNVSDIMIAGS